jgi:translation initiation factor IF-3
MSHRELGQKVLQRVIDDSREYAVIESAPRMEGRQLFMILAPNPKMLQRQRAHAQAKVEGGAAPAAPAAPTPAEAPVLAAEAAGAAPMQPVASPQPDAPPAR